MKAKHQKRDANRSKLFADLETALRAALNGEEEVNTDPPIELSPPATPSPRPRYIHRPQHNHKTTIRFSVRNHWGGNRFVVSYSEHTISELQVTVNAQRDMARKRYCDVIHLDTTIT